MNYLFGLVLSMVLIAHTASAMEVEWTYKDWKVTRYDNDKMVSYFSNGETMKRHQFGFYKYKGDCEKDTLLLGWSSSNSEVTVLEGTELSVLFRADRTSFELLIPLVGVQQLSSDTNLMTLANIEAGDQFIELLKSSHNIDVEILYQYDFTSDLGIDIDSFSLNGFIAARLKAQEYCQQL